MIALIHLFEDSTTGTLEFPPGMKIVKEKGHGNELVMDYNNLVIKEEASSSLLLCLIFLL